MRGILISVALHTLVLLAAALGVPWLAKPPANAARNFEVDIVRLSDITQAGKGEKPKPRTERKPDAERETTRKPVARDRRAGKPPEKPEPVKPKSAKPDLPRTAAPKPKPAEIEPPKAAKPKAQPKPKPPEKTAAAKPKAPPKPEPPKTTASAKPEAAPPTPPKPAKKAEPAPKPKAAPPKRVEIDPRALQRQASKPKKRAGVKKPEPPASKPAPKPVAKPKKKPKKKPETRMARPAPKPEKKTVPPRKPAPPLAKPKKKPEPGPKETAKKAEPKVERHVAALPRARPRPPAQPRPEKNAKQPPKAVKKPPARKDPLDSVFKTVGKLKKSQQSDRDRTAARTPAGVKTAARSLRLTLSEIQAVRRQIQPCWNFPAGAQNAGALRVRITIWLNRDGSVRDARILDGADFSGNAKLRAAADAGIRAVRNPRCSPLKLPPEKFDQWKVLTIDFDPSKLSSE